MSRVADALTLTAAQRVALARALLAHPEVDPDADARAVEARHRHDLDADTDGPVLLQHDPLDLRRSIVHPKASGDCVADVLRRAGGVVGVERSGRHSGDDHPQRKRRQRAHEHGDEADGLVLLLRAALTEAKVRVRVGLRDQP